MSLITTTKQTLIQQLGGITPVEVTEQITDANIKLARQYTDLLENQFAFYDQQLLDLQWQLREWEDIYALDNEEGNEAIARQSEQLYKYAPEGHNAVEFYTAMAVGTSLSIKIRPKPVKGGTKQVKEAETGPTPQSIFDTIFEAEENEAVFSAEARQEKSRDLLRQSRVVYLFFVGQDMIKARTLKRPFEITRCITNPNDESEIWFYRRVYAERVATGNGNFTLGSPKTIYYQYWRMKEQPVIVVRDGVEIRYPNQADWLKFQVDTNAKIATTDNGTPVYCYMLEWQPFFRAAIAWIRQQTRFMENRATIQQQRATWLEDVKVEGGSRHVENIRQRLASTIDVLGRNPYWETNPAAAPGAALVHNSDLESKQRSVATGADDAEKDGRLFRSMPAAAFGIPIPILYQDPQAVGSLNSIIEILKYSQALWQAYQSVWFGFFRRLVRFTLDNQGYDGPVIVDIDAPKMVETDSLDEYIKAVIDSEAANLVPEMEAARLAMVRLGSNNVDDLLMQLQVEKVAREAKAAKISGRGPNTNPDTQPANGGDQQDTSPVATAQEMAGWIGQALKDLREDG